MARSHLFIVAAVAFTGPVLGTRAAAQEPTIRIEAEDGRLVIAIGPFDLPVPDAEHDTAAMHMSGGGPMGMNMGGEHAHGAMVMPPVSTVEVPFDAYVYGFGYEVVDGDGNPVPTEVLHHLNVIDPDHRDLFLPISYRVAAVGSETGGMQLPRFLFGHPVAQGQRLVIAAMMHNPTGTAYENVTVRFFFKYMKTGRPWPLFSVYTFQMDVAFPVGDKDFDLPPGISSKSWEGSPSVDGRIIAIGGHMHQHAVNIVLDDVTDGDQVWEGVPILDEEGTLTGVTVGRLYRRFGVRIFKDHRYRVTVTYDNPTGDTIPKGGMGVVAGLFVPGVDAWPEADTTNELYRIDSAHYRREVRGTMDEIMAAPSDSTAAHRHNHGAP